MNSIMLIIKGFIVGIGKIIPGVSGSMLAFLLGIYEDAIKAINHFFKDFKYNLIYLAKIAIGVVLAILLCSNLIIYLLDNYYVYTMIFFIGLICGTLPNILSKVKPIKPSQYLYILSAFLFTVILSLFKSNFSFEEPTTIIEYLYIILLGFIDAATMIIPGISGTATYMLLGVYNFVLSIFSNPFAHISYSILFALGIVIGIIVVSKFIGFMLNKKPRQLHLFILGFLLSSIFFLCFSIYLDFKGCSLIICSFNLLMGFIISNKLSN